jgi:hypothetical protein
VRRGPKGRKSRAAGAEREPGHVTDEPTKLGNARAPRRDRRLGCGFLGSCGPLSDGEAGDGPVPQLAATAAVTAAPPPGYRGCAEVSVREAYSTRFDEAVAFTVQAFRTQRRKGSEVPYLTHLFAVMALVGEHGGDEDQMIAALLHDYLEDIEGSSADHLERRFGPRVRSMVEQMSDTEVRPKPPWRARKETHLARLAVAPLDVRLVVAADKLHNCEAVRRDVLRLGDEAFGVFNGGKAGTLWYYREAAEVLGQGWSHPLLDRLREAVRELHVAAG